MDSGAAKKLELQKAETLKVKKRTSATEKTSLKAILAAAAEPPEPADKKVQVNGRVEPDVEAEWHRERQKQKVRRKTGEGDKELNASRALEISMKLFILLGRGELVLTPKQEQYLAASLK